MSDPSDIRQSSVSSADSEKKTVSFSFNTQSVIKVLAVILLLVLAFWGGTVYGKHHAKTTSASNFTTGSSGFGGFRGGGGFGTVSAISSGSITVNNTRTGESKTYAITSSTKITDNGQTVSASSIADGDTVVVIPSSSDSSDAASIIVNPSFGGFGGGGSSANSSTGSGTTDPGSLNSQ